MSINKISSDSRAFTIAELVVVIVVIGILAGIIILGYGAWKRELATRTMSNDLTQVVARIESARNFTDGAAYPSLVTSTFDVSAGNSLSGGVRFGDTGYCYTAQSSAAPSIVYYVSSKLKTPSEGNCVEHSQTLAGQTGNGGYTDGTGTAARFNWTRGISTDDNGNVYVADYVFSRVRKITPSGVTTTIGGSDTSNGNGGYVDGAAAISRFAHPEDVAVAKNGNVYVADAGNSAIRMITPGGTVSTFVTGLPSPSGIVIDKAGTFYVTGNNQVFKVSSTGVVTTIAGSSVSGNLDGQGTAARFNGVQKIAIDSKGTLYVSDRYNHSIRKITSAGYVSTFAGSGLAGSSEGIGTAAQFNEPIGLAIDSKGVLYVGDAKNYRIRMIDKSRNTSTLIGQYKGHQDGFPYGSTQTPDAQFAEIEGLAFDNNDVLYVSSFDNDRIRKVIIP